MAKLYSGIEKFRRSLVLGTESQKLGIVAEFEKWLARLQVIPTNIEKVTTGPKNFSEDRN